MYGKIFQYLIRQNETKFWYILLTFGFAFGPFKSLPQNFSLFWNGSKFCDFGLGDAESWKSQYSHMSTNTS